MIFQIIQPSGILSEFIKYYWVLDTDVSEEIISERVLPVGTIEMMFHYKKSFLIKRSDNTEIRQPQSFICGMSSSYSDITISDKAGMISVMFYPYSAFFFFDFPLNIINDKTISLDCIYNNESYSCQVLFLTPLIF